MWPSGLGRWTLDYTIGVVVYQRFELEYQRENNKLSDEKYNSCTVFNHIYIYRFNSQCVALSRKANLGIVIKTVVYRRAHVLITLFVFVCA